MRKKNWSESVFKLDEKSWPRQSTADRTRKRENVCERDSKRERERELKRERPFPNERESLSERKAGWVQGNHNDGARN